MGDTLGIKRTLTASLTKDCLPERIDTKVELNGFINSGALE